MSRYGHNDFVAFSELDGFGVLDNRKGQALQSITSQTDDYILNVNKVEYVEHLVSEYSIQPLEIHDDQLSVSVEERMIPAEWHPNSYWVDSGKSYPKDVYTFHLPFTGDSQLLKVRASTYSMSAPRIMVAGQEIRFEIINFNQQADAIKREADNVVTQLRSQNQRLTNDLTKFNGSLDEAATRRKKISNQCMLPQLNQAFDARKAQLLKKHDVISALGIPVRKATGTPSTFSVPAKRTPAIPSKPLWRKHRNPCWLFPNAVGSPESIRNATTHMNRGGKARGNGQRL